MPSIGFVRDSQTGDITTGDHAGRDIYHGADADEVLSLLRYQIDKQSQFNMLLVGSVERLDIALRQYQSAIDIKLRLLRLIVALLLVLLLLVVWSLR